MINFGPVPAGSVLPIYFSTYGKTNGESITLTGLAITDVEIYKGTSVTQRSSDAGYVLIDTDGIDVDGITGIHAFSIDTGDNTDASFYAVGSFYNVVVSAVTVDAQTVNFIAATFRIVAAEAIAGKPKVDVDAWLGTAASTPTVAGVPNVNAKTWNDLTTVALPLIPTTAGRTLDVSAGGEAGLDWANIGSPTTAQNLSATNIDVDQIISGVGTVTTVTGNVNGSVGSVTGAVGSVTGAVGSVAAGGITAASFAANSITAAKLDPDVTTELQAGLATAAALATVDGIVDDILLDTAEIGVAGVGLTNISVSEIAADVRAEIVDEILDELLSGHVIAGSTGEALGAAGAAGDPWITALPGAYGAGTAGKIVGDNINATITSRMATYTQPTGFLAATFPGGTVANTTNITAGTVTTATNVTTVNGLAANSVTAAALAADAVTEIQSGLATAAALSTAQTSIDDLPTNAELATALGTADDAVLTQVALVKTQTDKLTFTVANQIDANIQYVNDVQVNGDGQTGTEWGP